MLFIRCAFCHKLIFRPLYAPHKAKHTKAMPDGQMTDHVTLDPKKRHHASLAGVPRAYRHPKCGGVTIMPEEIVRSYLVNPFLYSSRTFCCGCNGYVPQDQVFWIETGEGLTDYFRELQQQYLRTHGKQPPKPRV